MNLQLIRENKEDSLKLFIENIKVELISYELKLVRLYKKDFYRDLISSL